MSTQVEKITNIFRSVAQIPVLINAQIIKSSSIIVESEWSQRNLIRNKVVKLKRNYFLDNSLVISAMTYAEKTTELLSAISPSNSARAIIVQSETEAKDPAPQFVEIWGNGQLEHCFDVTSLEVHGSIYADTEFAALDWSPCEKKLLYIAEKKRPKSEPFFKTKPQNNDDTNSIVTKGEEYLYREEWGENLTGKVQSVIAVLKPYEQEAVSIMDQLPEYLCPGQARWAPDGSIVGVAWDIRPRKLGLIYCSNRAGFIFRISPKGEFSTLSMKGKAVRSPRFSPDGKWLVWIQRDAGGPHLTAHSLVKLAWPPSTDAQPEVVVHEVSTSIPTSNGTHFYGLYCMDLPKRCWFNNNNLLFSTVQRNEVKSYIVDIDTSSLLELKPKAEGDYCCGSVSILDTKDDMILASWSSIQRPSQLLIGKLIACDQSAQISWIPLSKPVVIQELQNHFVEYLDLQHKNNDEIDNCTAIFCGTEAQQQPLLVWAHGGPHSAFTNSFSYITAFFALLGFSVVQVNYRGSIGQGKASVDFLLGRVGDTDVKDCKLATTHCLEKFSCDANRCVLFGGSHGGFLVTHLSGQYPDTYRAVAARNAVIDISTMVYISDIPDWCAVEIGSEYFEAGPVNEEELLKMRKASPLMYAHKVKAPTLLLVGSKDLRVPSSQSILYYNKLKSNNCVVKMLVYEDNHPLSKPPVETDTIINSALWFIKHSDITL